MDRSTTNDATLDPSERARLEALEWSLWRTETRFDVAYMERILAPDFAEFGRSGRVYARADTLAVPRQPIAADLREMVFRVVAPDVVLLTYISLVRVEDETLRGNRSSLWSRTGEDWVLRFHQGTAVEQTPESR